MASDLSNNYANLGYQGSVAPKPERVSAALNGEARRRDPDTLPFGSGPWRLDPKRLWQHVGCRVAMDVDMFEKLSEGFDPAARAEVLDGLRNGFRFGVQEEPPPRGWAPSFMSDESRARITAYFEAETAARRMLGPFSSRPSGKHWGDAVTFPVSEVDKSDGKFRTIFNLSYDWENSANAGIPACAAFTTYPTFEEVAAEMNDVGLDDIYLAMFDIENAFRNIRIHPEDWKYQVVAWQRTKDGPKEWYVDLSLPFGIRVGPAIFNRFGTALAFILQQSCLSIEDREVVGKLIDTWTTIY